MMLYFLFDSGRNAAEVMTFMTESLVLDEKKISLEKHRVDRKNDNGRINLFYKADAETIRAISKARTVGIALQPTAQAAFFAGFDGMPFDDGAQKLPGFLQSCSKTPR
jgi:hypothetical protein